MPDLTHHEVEIRTDYRTRTVPGVGRDEHFPFYQPYCKTCGWVGDETVVKRADSTSGRGRRSARFAACHRGSVVGRYQTTGATSHEDASLGDGVGDGVLR